MSSVHTVGTWFRLIAHVIIPPTVKHLLYIDTDVVIMANLEELWHEIELSPESLFHWGLDMCAGFVVMYVPRMEEIWTLAQESPIDQIAKDFHDNSDQLIYRAVDVTYPNEVNVLSDSWAISAATHWQPKYWTYEETFKGAGMLHFNGGGSNKNAYFLQEKTFLKQFRNTWGTAEYYILIPWSWAQYQAKSMIGATSEGYSIKIRFWGSDERPAS